MRAVEAGTAAGGAGADARARGDDGLLVSSGSLESTEVTLGSALDNLRGRLALDVLKQRLESSDIHALDSRYELIGVNAMHGETLSAGHTPYEVRARVALRVATLKEAERVANEVEAMYLNGPAGGGGVTQSVREVIAAASALVPRSAVRAHCDILELSAEG